MVSQRYEEISEDLARSTKKTKMDLAGEGNPVEVVMETLGKMSTCLKKDSAIRTFQV